MLVRNYGLTTKDAITLLSFDDGERLEYYLDVVAELARQANERQDDSALQALGKMAGNWYALRFLFLIGTD